MKEFLCSFSSLPLIIHLGLLSVTSEKYVQELLVNRLFKLAQEKLWFKYVYIVVLYA